ncbi:MAG TPA: hypothetical protein VF191_10420, partial [Cyclobacteriaceae bacterium]
LKNIWQKSDLYKPRREEEITDMLNGRSKSIIARLRRNVWFELVFTIIGGMLLLYYVFSIPSPSFRTAFVLVLLSFLLYIIYYLKKIKLLNRFEGSPGNVRANLERLVHDLDAFLRFYYRSYTLLYPGYLLLIVILAIADLGLDQFLESLREWRTVAYLLFLVLLSVALSFWISKWYLGKLYGTHLQKLRGLLRELQEGENSGTQL